jgi:phenylpyruvate tautomerase PptA (4-oxalocrotonate tautomerase family)
MPVVDVLIVASTSDAPPADLAPRLAQALGELWRAAPGTVWVRLQVMPSSQYAENALTAASAVNAVSASIAAPLPPAEWPVFVDVLHRHWPAPSALADEAAALAHAVGQVLARDSSRVHVLYQPPGAGRMAFGGRLV